MWLLLFAGLCAPGRAAAQDPDMREIFPYVMLVIDTSGSMEYLPGCKCTTPGCAECLPKCDPGAGLTPEKNRWAVTLEALTGRFRNFGCEELARTTTFGATYDAGYFLPYHQPWKCTSGEYCALGAGSILDQQSDGILDQYTGQMQFGLMTFDGWDTYKGALPLIEPAAFDEDRSEGRDGLWSYGGFKTFRYPGCKNDYAMDTGVRSPIAAEGSLVSINSCTGGVPNTAACPSWCTSCDATEATLNTDIQEALLSARPYGGTPITNRRSIMAASAPLEPTRPRTRLRAASSGAGYGQRMWSASNCNGIGSPGASGSPTGMQRSIAVPLWPHWQLRSR